MWSVVVLGSAQDGGLPQFGSTSEGSTAARDGALEPRFSSSVAVVARDGRVLLLDAGPDLPAHAEVLRRHAASPDPLPIGGVAITHAHVGHYAGLIHFGREISAAGGLPCWVTPEMAEFLEANAPWRLLSSQGHVEYCRVDPGASFSPWPDLEARFISVPHRHEASDTVAISIEGSVLYLPDIDGWDEWPEAEQVLADHSVVLLDATFWSIDELPGRDIEEIRHPLVPDTLARFGDLAHGRRLILTHLNHSNPICDPASAEHAEALAAGFEVALEGLAITV